MKKFLMGISVMLMIIGLMITIPKKSDAQINYNVDIIGCINTALPSKTNEWKLNMLNDYIEYYNYQEIIIDEETGEEVSNPETKKQFANRMIQTEIINKVKSVRKKRAEQAVVFEELSFE